MLRKHLQLRSQSRNLNQMPDIEFKNVMLRETKLASIDAATMEFEGYGAVFGNVDAYGDVISPGAFAETLSQIKKTDAWPTMLLDHGGLGFSADDNLPIGIWTDLSEDGYGLKVKGKLLDTSRGMDTYKAMKSTPRPALDGLSIGYIAKEWTPRTKPDDPRRTLKKIDLIEISVVTFPANTKARTTNVKSARDMTEREFDAWLMRDAELSRSDRLMIINQGFKAFKAKRDAGGDDVVGALRALTLKINSK